MRLRRPARQLHSLAHQFSSRTSGSIHEDWLAQGDLSDKVVVAKVLRGVEDRPGVRSERVAEHELPQTRLALVSALDRPGLLVWLLRTSKTFPDAVGRAPATSAPATSGRCSIAVRCR